MRNPPPRTFGPDPPSAPAGFAPVPSLHPLAGPGREAPQGGGLPVPSRGTRSGFQHAPEFGFGEETFKPQAVRVQAPAGSLGFHQPGVAEVEQLRSLAVGFPEVRIQGRSLGP